MMTQNKVDYIYVVDANGKPVMPTSRLYHINGLKEEKI